MPLDPTRTVHVKDLHLDISESELFSHFSTVGRVSSVKLHRDRGSRRSLGFAFVTYYNPTHAAAAVAQLHYSTLNNQPIVVMWVGEHEALDPEANLFVRTLEASVTNEQLYELFAPFGRVISAKVMVDSTTHLSKGYGYVQFETTASAQSAMTKLQGFLFHGYQLQIDVFRPKSSRYPNAAAAAAVPSYAATVSPVVYDEGAYDDAYQAMYTQYQQALNQYNDYESYYYGDNDASGGAEFAQATSPTSGTAPLPPGSGSPSTSTTGAYAVNVRVVDESKGTLTDLSPSAPEWRPGASAVPVKGTSTGTSKLKADTPAFVPGGATKKSTTTATAKTTVASAGAGGSKLSPNAPVWTVGGKSPSAGGSSSPAPFAAAADTTNTPPQGSSPLQMSARTPNRSSSSPSATADTGGSLVLSTLTLPAPSVTGPIGSSPSRLPQANAPSSLFSQLNLPLTADFPVSSGLLSFPLTLSSSSSGTVASSVTSLPSGSSELSNQFNSSLLPAGESRLLQALHPIGSDSASLGSIASSSASTATSSGSSLPPSTPFSTTTTRLPISPSSPSSFAFSPTLITASSTSVIGDGAAPPTDFTATAGGSAGFPFAFTLSSAAFPPTPSSPFPLSTATKAASNVLDAVIAPAASSALSPAPLPSRQELLASFSALSQAVLSDAQGYGDDNATDSDSYQKLLLLVTLMQSFDSAPGGMGGRSSASPSVLFADSAPTKPPSATAPPSEGSASVLSNVASVPLLDQMARRLQTCSHQIVQHRLAVSSAAIASSRSRLPMDRREADNGEEDDVSAAELLLMADATGLRSMTSFD